MPANLGRATWILLLVFREKLFVHTFEFDGPAESYTNVVLHHEFCEALPVYQDHPLLEMGDVILRLCTEARRCDEDAFCRTTSYKAANKALHLGPANCVAYAEQLCLDVNPIETEEVLVNDAINTTIPRLTKLSGGIAA